MKRVTIWESKNGGSEKVTGCWYTEEEASELEACRRAIHALGIGTKRPPEEVFEHFRNLHGVGR